MRFYVGTSGYSYTPWKGKFYPANIPAKKMLEFYAREFDTVEINSSFYRVPAVKTLMSWAVQVPAEFRFSLKAPGRITHQQRLQGAEEATRYFFDTTKNLDRRRGPLLFQFPPSFAKDEARLDAFLKLLPADVSAAFEFRHGSWYDDTVYERLRAHNCALCVADTDEAGTTPLVDTAEWGYLRLRRATYNEEDLSDWLKRIHAHRWRSIYIFFKHEDEARGPYYAQQLKRLLNG